MKAANYISKRGLELLMREIHWLQKSERPKITAEVAYAASLGDRSENAEYIYGKKRLREIDRRLRYLIGRLDNIVPVDPAEQGKRGADVVRFGATVVLLDEEQRERTFHLFGEDEVDVGRGVLSWKSPIAKALLNKEVGDEVTYQSPGGQRTVEILEVRYEEQAPLPEGLDAWKQK